jgi:putative tryptophan/tyrosine transport system substrate-binding protein
MTTKFTRRLCVGAIAAAMLPCRSNAQQPPAPIIGLLDSSSATPFKLSTFYEGLKVEGFSRNQNVTVEYHSAENDYARLPQLAADLIDREVAMITALGAPAAIAAKGATTRIPVVFAISANPIEVGLVASLNHPGVNITGVTAAATGREQKRLELLHATIPDAPIIGFLLNPHNLQQDIQIKNALASAQKLGVQIKLVRASTAGDFGSGFAELVQSRTGSLVIADDEFFLGASAELGSLALRRNIAAIFEGAAFTAAGGLMSYGTRFAELYHQAGVYSGMVLAGAAPAELPIYQSTRVEMIANLRTAKTLGLVLPQPIIDQTTTLIR